jgi:hypothetical protein
MPNKSQSSNNSERLFDCKPVVPLVMVMVSIVAPFFRKFTVVEPLSVFVWTYKPQKMPLDLETHTCPNSSVVDVSRYAGYVVVPYAIVCAPTKTMQ